MNYMYHQPTRIHFGLGARALLPEIVDRFGGRAVLASDRNLQHMKPVAAIARALGPKTNTFYDIDANPSVNSVDALAELIRSTSSGVVVAVGGGSALDCAKAACSIAPQGGRAREYHSGGRPLDTQHVPLIAVPTTAGTGSEVTPIAVLDDPEKGTKAPLTHDNFFPVVAVVDPELCMSMPPYVTACTGLDALAHAIEGYWSRNHQPICEALSLAAVAQIFRHLPVAFREPENPEAREGMSHAALLAGMAFHLPKNAAVHACSYPLSIHHHLPHGAACAMTLDHFVRFNAPALGERGVALARAAGFDDMTALADGIAAMKKTFGMPMELRNIGVTEADIDKIVEGSFHPMMKNNPREVTPKELRTLYLGMF